MAPFLPFSRSQVWWVLSIPFHAWLHIVPIDTNGTQIFELLLGLSNIEIIIMETAGNCDGNTNYGDLFEHNGLCDFADCDDLRNFADCDYLCDFDRLRIVMICYLL